MINYSPKYNKIPTDEMVMDTNMFFEEFRHPWEPEGANQEARFRDPQNQISPMPMHMLLSGRLGTGKTATLTWWMLYWMFWHRKQGWIDEHGIRQQYQRVLTNYDVYPLLEEKIGSIGEDKVSDPNTPDEENIKPIALPKGVVGISPKRVPDEKGRMFEVGGVGEWRKACSSAHPMEIAKYRPHWAYGNHIGIDEIADLANNLRAGAAESRVLGAWLRQIRKMRMEGCFATQFVKQIPAGTLGTQIPLFVRLDTLRDAQGKPYETTAMFYDYAGIYYPRSAEKYKKGMDFQLHPPDWVRVLPNIDKVLGCYETEQMVAPEWETQQTKDRIYAEQERALSRRKQARLSKAARK